MIDTSIIEQQGEVSAICFDNQISKYLSQVINNSMNVSHQEIFKLVIIYVHLISILYELCKVQYNIMTLKYFRNGSHKRKYWNR